MNNDLVMVAFFIAPSVVVAFFAGYLWPRHPFFAGLGAVALLAGLLMVTSEEGASAVAPYAGMIALLAIVPALVIAWAGAKLRRRSGR